MDIDTLSPEDLRQYLHSKWDVPERIIEMLELKYLGDGKLFLLYGAIPLHTTFSLLAYGLLNVVEINIEPYWDEFDVISLKPNFLELCKTYIPPTDLPDFESSCEYETPNDGNLFDEEVNSHEIMNDYRGAPVFLLSEAKLRSEIETRDHAWITYRTPYRLEI